VSNQHHYSLSNTFLSFDFWGFAVNANRCHKAGIRGLKSRVSSASIHISKEPSLRDWLKTLPRMAPLKFTMLGGRKVCKAMPCYFVIKGIPQTLRPNARHLCLGPLFWVRLGLRLVAKCISFDRFNLAPDPHVHWK